MADGGPCARICNGVCGLIIGIILWPVALFLLGWNESRYVCEQKRILFAEANAKEIGCSNKELKGKQDTFAYLSCPFVSSTLLAINQCSWDGGTDGLIVGFKEEPGFARALAPSSTATDCNSLPKVNFTAVSAERRVQVKQCVESCETKTEKDSMGRNVDKKACSYKLDWSEKSISTSTFADQQLARSQCKLTGDGTNPLPPAWLDLGAKEIYANRPVVANTSQSDPSTGFKLNNGLTRKLTPADSVVDHYLEPPNWRAVIQCNAVGCVRLRYFKNSANTPSIFTRVSSDGSTKQQDVPGAWGCSASLWQTVFAKQMDKSEAIATLHAENSTLAWVLRVFGLFLTIFSIYLCLQPIAAAAGVAGDCFNFIPCGGYLQDMIEGLTCIILCPISTFCGCACGLFVVFFMWLFMRPVFACGGFLAVGLLCVAGAMIHRKSEKGKASRSGGQPDVEMSASATHLGAGPPMQAVAGQPMAMAQAVPVAVAPAAPPPTMMVACPDGCGPGSLVQVATPDGRQMQVTVPAGVGPGMQFQVQY